MPKLNTKQQRLNKEYAAKQQANMDKKDADNICETLDALLRSDPIKAREIIKNPRGIASLMQLHSGPVCIYVMHAVVSALVSENCSDILNEMSNEDIEILNKCISDAKKMKRPEDPIIVSTIRERQERRETGKIKLSTNGETRNMTPYEHWENGVMLKSMAIYQKVNTETFWQNAIGQLKRWSDAIETFEREPQQIATELTTDAESDELWTMDQLAEFLGIPKAQVIHKNIFVPTDKKELWFSGNTRSRRFISKYKYEYKTWSDARANENKAKKTVKSTVVKPATKPAKQHSNKTMLDVRAMDAFLVKLVELGEKSRGDMDVAIQKRKSIATQINDETDEEKIEKLTKELTKVNAEVKQHKSVVEQLDRVQSLIDKKNHAQDVKDTAERALSDAEKSFNSVVEEIAAFIESAKQNKK